jgi:hypothetical protein
MIPKYHNIMKLPQVGLLHFTSCISDFLKAREKNYQMFIDRWFKLNQIKYQHGNQFEV